jgi:outer membrane protein assembly factor BamE (lipoprotein component of BamABCDE complex)
MKTRRLYALLFAVVQASTVLAGERSKDKEKDRELTPGLVQREVRVGMSQTDVATALGSPNILTRDADGREAWVYDRVATEVQYRSGGVSAGGAGVFAPGTSLLLGLVGGHHRTERLTTSQRTLTVVIKFDASARVDAFTFHASRF